ncbi:MAG: hypothetical protein IJU51_08475 [Clostridia bacterium]|nr:hypothetical protein [Clostridia bacterium]
MVFCFLSAAVLYVTSLCVLIISTVIAVIYFQSAALPAGILVLISLMSTILAHFGAKKLYDHSMSYTIYGFEKWYSCQKRIAARCFRSSRMTVLLNIAYVCCAFEKTDECREALLQARPLIDRYGNAYYRYVYLMSVLGLKEKTHDMNYVSELIAETYALVRSPVFPKYEPRSEYLLRCDYALTELQLYARSPEQLAAADKNLVFKLRQLALELSRLDSGLSEIIGYSRLAFYYNAGLAAAILGDTETAGKFFGYIAGAPYSFPLCSRAQSYLLTGNLHTLMETIP